MSNIKIAGTSYKYIRIKGSGDLVKLPVDCKNAEKFTEWSGVAFSVYIMNFFIFEQFINALLVACNDKNLIFFLQHSNDMLELVDIRWMIDINQYFHQNSTMPAMQNTPVRAYS